MAQFTNCNPFISQKTVEGRLSCYWYNRLFDKAVSVFEWTGEEFEGPDATLNRDYLEWALMTQGQACFIKDKQGKLRGLDCSRIGYDCYRQPTSILVANPSLGQLNGTVGKNAVWVKNNKFAIPVKSVIEYYAGQLAKIQCSLNVSLNNNRMTKVFVAEDDAQAQNIRKMQDDVSAGKDAVIIKSDIADQILNGTDGSAIPVYSTPSEYLADKYLQDMRSVLNDFMVTFGINASGANMIKHERNLISEVDSNNQEIAVNRAYWLECREKAAEDCNKLFGTNIQVKIREPKRQEVETDVVSESSEGSSRDISELGV